MQRTSVLNKSPGNSLGAAANTSYFTFTLLQQAFDDLIGVERASSTAEL
jgi:hypothetical protein